MAVKPSSNNRFGRRSLVDDIAGVNKTSARKTLSAEDIIKKQHENAEKLYKQAQEEEQQSQTEGTVQAESTEPSQTDSTNTAENKSDTTSSTPVSDQSPTTATTEEKQVQSAISEQSVNSDKQTTTVSQPKPNEVVDIKPVQEIKPEASNTETAKSDEQVRAIQHTIDSVQPQVMESNQNLYESPNPLPTAQTFSQPIPEKAEVPNPQVVEKPYLQENMSNYTPGGTMYQPTEKQTVQITPEPAYQSNPYMQNQNPYNQNGYGYPNQIQSGMQPYQQTPYGQTYGQPVNAYGNNLYSPYAQPNPMPVTTPSEMHKTTDYSLFEDYPDINVRLPMKTGGDREMLKKSIMESGIADPIIVAPVQDVIRAFHEAQFPIPNYPENVQFIIIAGQNRRSLAKELGIELPFIIKYGLNKEQMDTIGLDTNLLNRQFSAMKPSEQVYIVNRRRALFEQNNTRNIRGKLSEITGYEKTYIYQLLSLVHVKKEMLTDFVDPGYISVSGITHLVTVPIENQERLYDYLIRNDIKKVMASQMKALLQDSTTPWTDAYLTNVMFPNQKKYNNITIRPDQYQGIIPEEDLPRANEIILTALKEYYMNHS